MVTLYCKFLDGGRLMARGRVGIDFVVPALIPYSLVSKNGVGGGLLIVRECGAEMDHIFPDG